MDSQVTGKSGSSCMGIVCLIAYQYFVIGVSTSLGDTMILTYPHLPPYSVISIFTAAHLPFSFKFLIAPLIERYTSVTYGKRKTWIIITCFGISLIAILMSTLTDERYQMYIAILYFFLISFSAVQSISVIALAIKEIEQPATISLVQQVMQTVGQVFGSLIFLKLVSADFARKYLGLDKALCGTNTFFIVLGIFIFAMNIVMHFAISERIMREQRIIDQRSLCEIIKEYRVFLDSNTRYFRQAVFFLIINQGHQFFLGGFQYELIKKGFSKERINQLDNLVMIPVIGITYLVSRFNSIPNLWRNIWIVMIIKLVKDIAVYMTMPTEAWIVGLLLFFSNSVATSGIMFCSTIVVSFPVSALSGMFITALNSARNLGNNGALHQRIIHEVGWPAAVKFGFVLQLTTIAIYWYMVDWVKQGVLQKDRLEDQPVKADDVVIHSQAPW